MKKKTIIITASVVFLVGFLWFLFRSEDEIEYKSQKVEQGDIFQTVSVTGELKSEEEIILNFEGGGRLKTVDIYSGKEVVEGETLASIDDVVLNQRLIQAKASLDQALASAGANDDSIRESKELLDNSDDYYDEIVRLESQKIDAVERDFENAKDYYNDVLDYYNKVVDDSGENSSEEKYAKISLTNAKKLKEAAEEAVQTAKRSRDVNEISAKNAKDLAEEKLKSARSQFTRNSNDAAVKSARAAYKIALDNLQKADLKAPVSGLITEVNYEGGEVLGAVGTSSGFAKLISSDFILEADIPESDIAKVKNAQLATVSFDAFDDSDNFEAQIIEIDPAATIIQDVVYYKIKLKLTGFDLRLKPGMSADIDIHTAKRENVLKILQRAIHKDNEKKYVDKVIAPNQFEVVEVKTGLRGDEGNIEIISGLKLGDEVVTLRVEEEK